MTRLETCSCDDFEIDTQDIAHCIFCRRSWKASEPEIFVYRIVNREYDKRWRRAKRRSRWRDWLRKIGGVASRPN